MDGLIKPENLDGEPESGQPRDTAAANDQPAPAALPRFDAPPQPGPGATLRAERERRGYSREEVAAALKLAPRQLEAIEADDFDALRGQTFARGFVKNYARLLQLDAEPLLARIRPAAPPAPEALAPRSNASGHVPVGGASQGPLVAAGLAVLALVVLAVVGSYGDFSGGSTALNGARGTGAAATPKYNMPGAVVAPSVSGAAVTGPVTPDANLTAGLSEVAVAPATAPVAGLAAPAASIASAASSTGAAPATTPPAPAASASAGAVVVPTSALKTSQSVAPASRAPATSATTTAPAAAFATSASTLAKPASGVVSGALSATATAQAVRATSATSAASGASVATSPASSAFTRTSATQPTAKATSAALPVAPARQTSATSPSVTPRPSATSATSASGQGSGATGPVITSYSDVAPSYPPTSRPGGLAMTPMVGKAAAPGAGKRLTLKFEEDAWVEVRDNSGKIVFSQLSRAGSTRVIDGKGPMSLVVGNAHHVRLNVDDKPFDLKPHIGVTVARFSVD